MSPTIVMSKIGLSLISYNMHLPSLDKFCPQNSCKPYFQIVFTKSLKF